MAAASDEAREPGDRNETLSSFAAELKRRKVVKVGAAYAVVAWLAVQAASIAFPAFEAPAWALRVFIFVMLLGFPIALVLAWMLDLSPEGLKLEAAPVGNKRVIAVSLLLAALAVAWYLRGRVPVPAAETAPPPASVAELEPPKSASGAEGSGANEAAVSPKSIAVLPFVNMSGEPENEFFADGMSEEILNSLTRIDGMEVVGRTSSFRFKGKSEDLRSIGAQLGVANVLEGSVRRGKDRARITAQLIRVTDGIHLWSQTYDRVLDDTLAVQLDIAENVAGALDVVLDQGQRERMREAGVQSVDAFIAFQKGRKLFSDAHDPSRSENLVSTLRLANAEFDKATALEPDFASAYHLSTDLYTHILMADEASDAERKSALESALRAYDLAVNNARDTGTRLLVEVERQLLTEDWRGLHERFRAALEQQGCRPTVWAMVAPTLGLARERLAAMRRVITCDPLAVLPYYNAAMAANWVGQPEAALAFAPEGTRTTGGAPSITGQSIRALVTLGRLEEARAELANFKGDPAGAAMAQRVIAAAAGEDLGALEERLARERSSDWNPELASIADGVGEALAGDRAASNRRAARIDAQPGGPLNLLVFLAICQCGVPFDMDAAPNLKARIEEAGVPWPPPDLIAPFMRKRDSG